MYLSLNTCFQPFLNLLSFTFNHLLTLWLLLLNYTRSGLQLVSIGSSLLYAPFGYVHTFSDLLYILHLFYLIPSFQPLYLFLYMLPTSRSVSLSVIPIIPTESKSTLYLFTYYFVPYITFITVVLTTIGLSTATQLFLSH